MIADYSEAIRIRPGYVDAYNNRGVVRKEKGDYDGAIADYNEAIRLDPLHVSAYNNRGLARSSKGDRKGALALIIRVIAK
jgi:tetratricopeptide (TPR) repeat protein